MAFGGGEEVRLGRWGWHPGADALQVEVFKVGFEVGMAGWASWGLGKCWRPFGSFLAQGDMVAGELRVELGDRGVAFEGSGLGDLD